MVRSPVKVMTLAKFLLLPETKPANEFIDGQITQKPMPQGKYSLIQSELTANINAAFKPQRLVRAFSELSCNFEFAKDFHLTLGDLFGWLRD